jgi:hypothetical protein
MKTFLQVRLSREDHTLLFLIRSMYFKSSFVTLHARPGGTTGVADVTAGAVLFVSNL